jgi:D-tyrosyl-tRNA(Tyr) deacylase
MRAVVQRVTRARVEAGGETCGAIAGGLCVLVGVGREDTEADARALADKITGLRVFEDASGKMNANVADSGGSVLAISQFTLYGDARKGRRPSFSEAMEPTRARELFELFCAFCRENGVAVETGRFREHMELELVNSGPVTILLDTARVF